MSGEESFNFKSVIFKNLDGITISEARYPTNASVHEIYTSVVPKDSADPSGVILVFHGQILGDKWLTVEEVFGKYGKPIVFVVNKRSHERSRDVSSNHSANRTSVEREEPNSTGRAPTNQQTRTDTEEQGRCRICYSSETTPGDPLFHPCLCRGTVGLVHVSCLNAWRERPENPEAYFRCPNCGYEYRIARARFAQLLSSEEYARIGTTTLMVIIVLIAAFFSWTMLPDSVTDMFFDLIEWVPPDAEYPLVRHLVFGISCIGLAGFLVHVSEMLTFVREHGTMETMFAFGLGLTANGKRGIRLFAFCGLAVAYRMMFVECDRIVRRIFTAFGERVLAVGEDESR